MELLFREEEHIKLLTQIRRSYWRIEEKLKENGIVKTDLFTFRDEGKERFGKRKHRYVRVFSVVVKKSRRKFYVTLGISYGRDVWYLWRTDR